MAQNLPLSQIYPSIDSVPALAPTPVRTLYWIISSERLGFLYILVFFITVFVCLVLCVAD